MYPSFLLPLSYKCYVTLHFALPQKNTNYMLLINLKLFTI